MTTGRVIGITSIRSRKSKQAVQTMLMVMLISGLGIPTDEVGVCWTWTEKRDDGMGVWLVGFVFGQRAWRGDCGEGKWRLLRILRLLGSGILL